MDGTSGGKEDHDEPVRYEIRVNGHLDSRWTDWFDGLTITREASGDTLLTGPVVDQAALHGMLKRVRDLGMPLVSVARTEPAPTDAPDADAEHEHTNKETDR